MKRVIRTLVAVLMLLLVGSGTVQVDHGHGGGYYRGWEWLPFWFEVTAITALPALLPCST
jgi:hypothetical protein